MHDYVRYKEGTAIYKRESYFFEFEGYDCKQVLKPNGEPVDRKNENYVFVSDLDLEDGMWVEVDEAEVEAKLKGSNMTKLYEWKDAFGQQKFGTKLATNSEGKWVMEVKGTSEVVSVDKYEVEEVIPHTIDIKFFNGSSDRKYSYLAPKGKYNIGEVFVLENQNGVSFVTIVGVDTKSSSAHKEFTPTSQLVTKPVDNNS